MAYKLEKFAKVLELDKVLEMLADEATFFDAKQKALDLHINLEIDTAAAALRETAAAYDLLGVSTSPIFSGIFNNSVAFERANVGGALNCKELLDIASTLRSIRLVKCWREDNSIKQQTDIDYLFNSLIPNKYFEEKIFSCIKNEEDLNDDASPELRSIRRKIALGAANIREKLEKIIHSPSYSKILQDAIITQRNSRFVVPIKSEFKGQFSGIVHDLSSSGATLFVEPMAIVQINNDLHVLRLKEKAEIERILAELSAEVASFSESIKHSYTALTELALVFAKANLAYKMKATMPRLNTNGRTVLKNARHPLIDSKRVVPISLELGNGYNSLIITGPNTGGKTVTLKTIGLMTLMALSGLMIPCDDDSEISVYDNILVDIGDEQSIEQSLSTFSAHMTNIVAILKNATPFSLVLLDELGAGTDPVEGAALAQSILISLAKKGCRIAATTHYAELKAYALETDGVQNASCEFDVDSLKPTYRLLIGVPGRSNAFAISQKLGIDTNIISRAQGYISEENSRFENIISALEKERQATEKLRLEALAANSEAQIALKNAREKQANLDSQCDKMLEKARGDAVRIIESSRKKANEMLNELEEIKKQATKENASTKFSDAKRISKKTIDNMLNEANPVRQKIFDYKLPRTLVCGDNVLMLDLNKEGGVLEIKGEKALISMGVMKIWTDISNLKLIEQNKQKVNSKISGIKSGVTRQASLELDIRGFAADEGIIEVDRFIDNAILSGLSSITIIHGKGTGVLRSAVHGFLRKHKAVKGFRTGVFGEGENGVTIAELK